MQIKAVMRRKSKENRPLPWVKTQFDPTTVHHLDLSMVFSTHFFTAVVLLLLSKRTQHEVSREDLIAKEQRTLSTQ